jgi:hypothetical protein
MNIITQLLRQGFRSKKIIVTIRGVLYYEWGLKYKFVFLLEKIIKFVFLSNGKQ